MRLNRKQKLFIFFSLFLFAVIGSYLYYLNKPRRLNVILITIDALRPDHLGCYGYKRNTSPNIDKLAKEGVMFTQAISQGSFTAPSLVSLMTSIYPDTHKVKAWENFTEQPFFTLAQILKNNGFYTGVICAHNFFVSILGLEKGFDTLSTGIDISAEDITRQALLWIDKNKNKRFFLWLHYFDPHGPYRPPTHIKAKFESMEIKNGNKQVPILKNRPADPDICGGLGGIPDYTIVDGRRDVDYYISLYDGEVEYVDEQIGVLLEKLKIWDLYKNTLVILTADHGESLGEHDLYFTHGTFLYDQLIRVPLIIKFKELFTNNQIIEKQVRLIDIMPTIFSISRIKWNKRKIEGVNLLPIIFKKGEDFKLLYAFSVHEDKYSIRTPVWKLIYNSNQRKYELYNLKNDPQELNNLVETEKNQFKLLKSKLEEWMNRPKPDITPLTKPLDEETKEKLKSLGYLQ